MKALITGARGQVGTSLQQRVPAEFEAIALSSAELDITQQAAVEAAIAKYAPDIIINAAAYTAVDKAESDQENAYKVNADAVGFLGEAAEKRGIPMLHISTDYVFDGTKSEPYVETDTPNPINVYGASKLAGEQKLAEVCSKYIILRTSWVYSDTGNNFKKTMIRLAQTRDELSVVADQIGGPTHADDIADMLWKIAQHYCKTGEIKSGIYHFSGQPYCSWYEFALKIFDEALEQGVIAKIPKVNPITTAEYPTPAKRAKFSCLLNSKII